MSKSLLAVAAAAALTSGCVNKHYGRQEPVSAIEAKELSCSAITKETEKVLSFKEFVRERGRFSAHDAAAFLVDFGIGNKVERSRAYKSADDRITQLERLYVEKGCAAAAAPQP